MDKAARNASSGGGRAGAETPRRPFGAIRHQWTPPVNDNMPPLARRLAALALGGLVLTALVLLVMGLVV